MPFETYEAEIKMLVALTESGRCWEYRRTQSIKWTAEGAVKGRRTQQQPVHTVRVFRNVRER